MVAGKLVGASGCIEEDGLESCNMAIATSTLHISAVIGVGLCQWAISMSHGEGEQLRLLMNVLEGFVSCIMAVLWLTTIIMLGKQLGKYVNYTQFANTAQQVGLDGDQIAVFVAAGFSVALSSFAGLSWVCHRVLS